MHHLTIGYTNKWQALYEVHVHILTFMFIKLRNYLPHGAETFLRSQQFLSQSQNSIHFMGHKGSLPCPQKHITCPYLLVHALPPHFLSSQFFKYSHNKINKCTNVKIIFLTHNLSVWHRHTLIMPTSSSSITLLIQFNTL